MKKPEKSTNTTMTDVAKAANVSVATVSNVINQRLPVSDRIRKRVLKAIDELGYRHNLTARALKTGTSNIIGLIVPNLANPFFSEMAKLVIDGARQRGYIVAVIDSQNQSQKELESFGFLVQHGVQGVIWYDPRSKESEILNRIAGHKIVVVDRDLQKFDSIVPNYEKAGYELGLHVTSRGHERIGLLSGPQENYGARLRRRGILKALRGNAEIVWECENRYSEVLSAEAMQHVLAQSVTTIMCGNDAIAIGTLLALGRAKIKVPEEVSITGFDDTHLCELVTPRLTSVTLPRVSVVGDALDWVIGRVQGDDSAIRHLSLDLEIAIRDSVRTV